MKKMFSILIIAGCLYSCSKYRAKQLAKDEEKITGVWSIRKLTIDGIDQSGKLSVLGVKQYRFFWNQDIHQPNQSFGGFTISFDNAGLKIIGSGWEIQGDSLTFEGYIDTAHVAYKIIPGTFPNGTSDLIVNDTWYIERIKREEMILSKDVFGARYTMEFELEMDEKVNYEV